ncbi:MAG: caspase family protein [Deltaproteobacteria bacterium]|nr:caspase family protein [Deltaproteobacteria bacterium]
MRAWLVTAAFLTSSAARAEVERYAILAGNNEGARDESSLEHAGDDARRLGEVLGTLGSFPPENVVMLEDRSAAELRRAIIAMNERIRARLPGTEPILLVYYSGHADAQALHMGESELELAELESLVRGSPAAFRVLIVDACRSGSLTRVKRGKPVAPFPVQLEERLDGEGVVFLAASSANEDAQESDELGGSFFTHHFVTGLLGAADENRDARVGLREAYAYAYDETLRASSRSLEGLQHPTFRYELKGRADLILTHVAPTQARGVIEIPSGESYVIFRRGLDGPVVAETGRLDRIRRMSMPPGRYGVRSPRRNRILEGTIEVSAAKETRILDAELEEVAHARLARKGGREIAHGFELGAQAETPIWDGSRPCLGPVAGYSLDLAVFGVATNLGARATYCRDGFRNAVLESTSDVVTIGAGIAAVLDTRRVSFSLGLVPEISFRFQGFATRGIATSRIGTALGLSTELGIELPITLGFALRARAAAVTHSLEEQGSSEVRRSLRVSFRGSGLVAKSF